MVLLSDWLRMGMKPSEGNAEQSGMRTAVTFGTAKDGLAKRARAERRKRIVGAMVWDETGFLWTWVGEKRVMPRIKNLKQFLG
jgi:hypothetical protein